MMQQAYSSGPVKPGANRLRTAATALCPALLALLVSGCGETRTSGFFEGHTIGVTFESPAATGPAMVIGSDTLANWTFDDPLQMPFGRSCPVEIYHGACNFDNSAFAEPLVALCTAGLLRDGLVEAQFDLVSAPSHAVLGLVLRAADTENFLLLGVNSRGQFTVQKCINGLWFPVMGLEAFETSRLLPYNLPGLCVSAEVHGNYVDFRVNGQLVTVVRTSMPAVGQVGVFVDGYVDAALDRLTVIPVTVADSSTGSTQQSTEAE
ncbi:hypothetical protein JW921_11675 [Candidatus Fermentibacterales bacterium]|nr:hypothetical protein [Candidatus Fermentibacterales bacterium]